jgi:acetyl-CoA carboxylase biotin carboxylase subunit
MDEGVYPGFVVPMDYDPLLGKLIVWASTREEAIARMKRALDEYYVSGIQTNLDLFRRILADPAFIRAEFHTRWLDDWLQKEFKAPPQNAIGNDAVVEDAALLGALAWYLSQSAVADNQAASANTSAEPPPSRWKIQGRAEQVERSPQK